MKILIIAGNTGQFHDYCRAARIHSAVAVDVYKPAQLRGVDPAEVILVTYGTYHDNPAYQSPEYLSLQGEIEGLATKVA